MESDVPAREATAATGVPAPPSAWLGIGVLATVSGYYVIFGDGPMGSRGGFIAGYMLGAAMLALPFFLTWRFGSKSGRSKPLPSAFNVFCWMVAVLTALILAAAHFLPEVLLAASEERRDTGPRVGQVVSVDDPNAPPCLAVETGIGLRLVPPRCHPWQRDWDGKEAAERQRGELVTAKECADPLDELDAIKPTRAPCIASLEYRDLRAGGK